VPDHVQARQTVSSSSGPVTRNAYYARSANCVNGIGRAITTACAPWDRDGLLIVTGALPSPWPSGPGSVPAPRPGPAPRARTAAARVRRPGRDDPARPVRGRGHYPHVAAARAAGGSAWPHLDCQPRTRRAQISLTAEGPDGLGSLPARPGRRMVLWVPKPMPAGDTRQSRLRRGRAAGHGSGPGR
jgi:hypothetical protein